MKTSLLAHPLLALATCSLLQTEVRAQCSANELAELAASDLFAGDQFGRSVDIDGDLAVVGASEENFGVGSAYLHEWDGLAWIQVAKLTPSNGVLGDKFGTSVSISGDTVVVGAYQPSPAEKPGLAYVFVKPAGGWADMTETAQLTAASGADNDNFGYAVDMDADTILVGAYLFDNGAVNTGAAFVFERPGSGWVTMTESATLTPGDPDAQDQFGISVSIAGDTIAVGADRDSDALFQAGSAYVFERAGATWSTMTDTAKLTAASPVSIDRLGISVGVGTESVVVGAWADDTLGTQAGAAYVFERPLAGWSDSTQTAKLTASDAAAGDHFGWAVDAAGEVIAVGAPANLFDGSGLDAAYLFLAGPAGWSDSTEDAIVTQGMGADDDHFGLALALGGGRLLVGAHFFPMAGFSNAGGAYIFAGAADCNGNQVLDLCEIVSGAAPDTNGDGLLDECALPGSSYCTAGTSASGCQASITAIGTPSASAPSGFALEASGVEGQKDALFFFGTSGQQANTWGNGTSLQCVVPPVMRAGLLSGTGTAGQCDGVLSRDLNARWTAKPSQNPGAGTVVQAQLWYRDPQNTSNQTTSLSDATEFTVGP